MKDFLFSHEPSVWRFDVDKTMTNETLTPNARYNPNRRSLHNDQPTVIDITDDATGAPHDIAESHMSMYVNEVGHNPDLVENIEVSPLRGFHSHRLQHVTIIVVLLYHSKSRNNEADAVTYYINIDKPLAKGDTVELLVNYKVSQISSIEIQRMNQANSISIFCRRRTSICEFAEGTGGKTCSTASMVITTT